MVTCETNVMFGRSPNGPREALIGGQTGEVAPKGVVLVESLKETFDPVPSPLMDLPEGFFLVTLRTGRLTFAASIFSFKARVTKTVRGGESYKPTEVGGLAGAFVPNGADTRPSMDLEWDQVSELLITKEQGTEVQGMEKIQGGTEQTGRESSDRILHTKVQYDGCRPVFSESQGALNIPRALILSLYIRE